MPMVVIELEKEPSQAQILELQAIWPVASIRVFGDPQVIPPAVAETEELVLRVKIGAWGYESLISSLKSHPSRLVVLIMSDATVVIRRRNGSITAGIMAHDECDFRVRSWGRIDDFVDAIRAIGPGCHARTGWGRTAHLIKDGSADVVGFAEFTKQQNLPPLVIAEINRHKRG